ncbi:unnamed protein product, partial [Rotaria sordida]
MNSTAVTIVVGGDFDAIHQIYRDLKNRIPVIIINDSGGVADYFNRWLLSTKHLKTGRYHDPVLYGTDELHVINVEPFLNDNKKNQKSRTNIEMMNIDASTTALHDLFQAYNVELKTDLEKIWNDENDLQRRKGLESKINKNKNERDLEDALTQVRYCLQPAVRCLITSFNLNSATDLSEKIFESIGNSLEILTGNSGKQNIAASFLELSMDWNCIHVAKALVLKNSLRNIPNREDAFIKALDDNLPTFIYEFLRLGIEPSEIFFPPIKPSPKQPRYITFLKRLYNDEVVNRDETHLKFFIHSDKEIKTKKIDTLKTLNKVLRNLIGDYMYELYFETEEEKTNDRIKWGLIKGSIQPQPYDYDDTDKKGQSYDATIRYARKYIMRDLFLWAILMNYIDMAKVFLSFMDYRICSALIATKILKKYYSVAIYGELKDGYEKSFKYFEKYAIDCINKCDDHDINRTCYIVLQRNELYGYVTCLQVASDADDKLFISAPSCVEAMRNVFYDKLFPEQTK